MSRLDTSYFTIVLFIIALSIGYVLTAGNLPNDIKDIDSFSSEQDFKNYLQEIPESEYGYYSGMAMGNVGSMAQTESILKSTTEDWNARSGEFAEPGRVSETNVQVLGIDEPDILKTDGKEIYYSLSEGYRHWDYNYKYGGKTKVISAFPPESLSLKTEIDKNGNLLLYNNILIIFSGNKIYGYDVSNPESPEEKWDIDLNTTLITARLFNGKIYLVTRNRINYYHPCPIIPLSVKGIPINIECSRIYHPRSSIPVDTTYNAIVFNPNSGKIEKTISFVGSTGYSIVYMSENAIYISYQYYESMFKLIYNFLNEDCRDLMDARVIEKLNKLKSYDISDSAKMVESQQILEQYFNLLSDDEKMRIQNEFSDRFEDYFKNHKRDLEKTGIAKIGLNMEISGAGKVPGKLLNQFSMDEYKNHLRVATTVGQGSNSVNDVYVLNSNMNIVGSVEDLGETERIYSVRFLQDKGYVVTFRQIDPLHVLDLSNPENPELKGELKIPGYSSYLHPITKDKILGIGKEDFKMKVSLFDVSSPENPVEADKYLLDEYWSDILSTHHAFLIDKKHKIFFLPGSKGGYIFSYENDNLKLKKTISNIIAKRAVYINDYLYILGNNKIVVLDENTWEKVKEFEL